MRSWQLGIGFCEVLASLISHYGQHCDLTRERKDVRAGVFTLGGVVLNIGTRFPAGGRPKRGAVSLSAHELGPPSATSTASRGPTRVRQHGRHQSRLIQFSLKRGERTPPNQVATRTRVNQGIAGGRSEEVVIDSAASTA